MGHPVWEFDQRFISFIQKEKTWPKKLDTMLETLFSSTIDPLPMPLWYTIPNQGILYTQLWMLYTIWIFAVSSLLVD